MKCLRVQSVPFEFLQLMTWFDLFAGGFQLLQLARHWQIHSWPMSDFEGIQFDQYCAVLFSSAWWKNLHFLPYEISFNALVALNGSKKIFRVLVFDWMTRSNKQQTSSFLISTPASFILIPLPASSGAPVPLHYCENLDIFVYLQRLTVWGWMSRTIKYVFFF